MINCPACLCGVANQDINHIIFECEFYSPKALQLYEYLHKKFPLSSASIFPVLSRPMPKLCCLLLAFIKATKLFF